ncbi:uncharacterized protein A4U43_C01F11290 [Asparagus officinalis]|uniref:Uncharacterized protein n=1 Tax=Asparagus officinalis TaxID=4686 RepID=A0A5P1FR24_ASPOF|nr:uncharacterized protein A4U43_C01F11290 [Asparagus officinalis]
MNPPPPSIPETLTLAMAREADQTYGFLTKRYTGEVKLPPPTRVKNNPAPIPDPPRARSYARPRAQEPVIRPSRRSPTVRARPTTASRKRKEVRGQKSAESLHTLRMGQVRQNWGGNPEGTSPAPLVWSAPSRSNYR